ncbi:MAG: SBBP repeat-containing protein [Bacteroidia bacterium]|nr:SBBP repeat-containing protein [Bacteroidia bacterium]
MNPNYIARTFLNFFLLSLTNVTLFAQPQWLRSFGGSDAEAAASIASDGVGGVYTIGTFSGNTVFGSYNMSSNGKGDVYIVKSNAANGNILWIRQIGSAGEDNGYGIVCDKSGNIYCTGRFSGNVSFGSHVLTSSGSFDAFVARLNPSNGLVTWAVNSGGIGSDAGLAITADTLGNIFTCGYFQIKGVFGSNTLTAVGQNLNAYVAKIDTSGGNTLWANGFGSLGYTYPLSISCDAAGDVYLTGQFDGSMLVGPATLTAVKYNDIFITKHNALSGTAVWATSMGGDGDDIGNAVTIGSDKQVYFGGRFEQTLSSAQSTLVSKGNADAIIGKLDATTGTINWLKQFGGDSFEQVNGIGHDASGNIYLTGQYNGICDFDVNLMMSNGNADVFLCRMNSSGKVTWDYSMGSPLADIGSGIICDQSNAIYCTGNFQSSMKAEAQSVSSSGSSDIFVIKIDRLSVGVDNISMEQELLSVFPSPAHDILRITGKKNARLNFTVRISDISGRTVLETVETGAEAEINISELQPAVYILTYVSEGSTRTTRFIKQ